MLGRDPDPRTQVMAAWVAWHYGWVGWGGVGYRRPGWANRPRRNIFKKALAKVLVAANSTFHYILYLLTFQ